MDLTDGEALERFTRTLAAENPEIVLLVNAAGFGKFQAVEDVPGQIIAKFLPRRHGKMIRGRVPGLCGNGAGRNA